MDWAIAIAAIFLFVGGHGHFAFGLMLLAVTVGVSTIAVRLHQEFPESGWLMPKLLCVAVFSAAAFCLGNFLGFL
ncbi:hypothetical protein C7U92_06925 [Bradyrhizobium sp. WBOS7]|uniref:Uncharacterized protein n=1 Tax=Bradyrhizobium betae TaxID=244734 RepID=A0AAE9NFU7_9BRAD|nr:hypothetical protein [Bradyrhizobium sp. WBOS2]MDD1569350.1 hypothetical protein [Bradyrhizobium sp. WBOS1]MDD1576469.1 hypothetical protein [Bradyrhizobium sp. WBOS7]MDD1602310.1 hypothetical protein [Bradyrhizobium sp. WBOS16]UUO38143.1 hypothetical protein DCK84_28535 [Bradyrhizobium sp. WBOS01]UUO44309.1 hypothetical protein DCM75_28505 [Bradyrhizobium sp. WBOS02]UUO54717.1 hypothetical protein DCM79_18100 [Bradyrhizobium sp. WBOS07]UUO68718.1 hypothetical protein DCM83_28210 [Bradyrh